MPIPPATVHWLLTDAFFAPLRVILETTGIPRQGHSLDDRSFATLSIRRALQAAASGRDFLQMHALPQVPELTRSNYFASSGSKRRLAMMQELARHRRTIVDVLVKFTFGDAELLYLFVRPGRHGVPDGSFHRRQLRGV